MRRRGQGGFTIIEVMMAVTLMAIALSGIAMTGVVSMRADTTSHQSSAANTLAQAKLEQLRNTPRTATAWLEGAHTESGLDANGMSHPQGEYARQWTVDLDYNAHPGLARVTVVASWGGQPGQAVTLSSLYW